MHSQLFEWQRVTPLAPTTRPEMGLAPLISCFHSGGAEVGKCQHLPKAGPSFCAVAQNGPLCYLANKSHLWHRQSHISFALFLCSSSSFQWGFYRISLGFMLKVICNIPLTIWISRQSSQSSSRSLHTLKSLHNQKHSIKTILAACIKLNIELQLALPLV